LVVKAPYQKGRRLRLFGGPNGSGKSTLFQTISGQFDLGVYLNPDEIEKDLKTAQYLDLYEYGLNDDQINLFEGFISKHSLIRKARASGYSIDLERQEHLIVNPDKVSHSYEASLLVDFIRTGLIVMGRKLSFETVMSHPSKIEILKNSRKCGYKNYLYFLATETPEINIERVRLRVSRGGHPVMEDKIQSRYFASLNLLRSAVSESYRAFIFDNSEKEAKLILEVYEGREFTMRYHEIPKWVDQYLLS